MRANMVVLFCLICLQGFGCDTAETSVKKGINYKIRPCTFSSKQFAIDINQIDKLNYDFVRLLIEPCVVSQDFEISHSMIFITIYKEIDSVLNYHGLKSYISLHKYKSPSDSIRNIHRMFWHSDHLDSSLTDFKRVVLNTCRYETVLGYSWIEEPQIRNLNGIEARIEGIHAIQQELVTWINKNAKGKKILVSTSMGAHVNGYKNMQVYNGENVIYNFYMFSPKNIVQGNSRYPGTVSGRFWDSKAIAKHIDHVITFARANNVDIMCGSYGCNNYNADCTEYLKDLESLFVNRGVPYSYHVYNGHQKWSLKKKKKLD